MPKNDILHIFGANVVRDQLLRLDLDDPTQGTVVVAPLIERPVFEPLRDPKYFELTSLIPSVAPSSEPPIR
jgi:hypothetical protein